MWEFIGFIILLAIIFGVTPHEAFMGVAGVVLILVIIGGILYFWDISPKIHPKNDIINSNKKEVDMQSYGGIGATTMNNIQEGEVVVKKPEVVKKPTFWGAFLGLIKLIAITILLMAIMWGISYLMVGAK